MTKRLLRAAVAALLAGAAASSHALPLTNGSLTVDIRADNGAINSVVFGGSEYYRRGAFISDYGFAGGLGGINTTNGGTGIPISSVSAVGGSVVVTGALGGVGFTRTYSLVTGLNVLRTSTVLTNNGAGGVSFFYGDYFDPDQGVDLSLGFVTKNDLFTLNVGGNPVTVGESTTSASTNTVVMGSLDPSLLNFGGGSGCNVPTSGGLDGNGALADTCVNIGSAQINLVAGASYSYSFDQAYGLNPTTARDAFVAANAVPAPATLALVGLGLAGLGWVRRRSAA